LVQLNLETSKQFGVVIYVPPRQKQKLRVCLGGSVPEALLDLAHWIRINGGVVEVKEVEDREMLNKQEWVRYGIFCGMLS
jgi:uncharacterized protein YqgQ